MISDYQMCFPQQEQNKYKIKINECRILFPNTFERIGHFFSELFTSLTLIYFTYSSNVKVENVTYITFYIEKKLNLVYR